MGWACVDIHAENDFAFQWACKGGLLETAKWLHGLGGVDVHAWNEYSFREACGHGHLETAKWLHGLSGVDIHARADSAFWFACENGHLETGRWLIDRHPAWHWPPKSVKRLQVWSPPREAWIRAVVAGAFPEVANLCKSDRAVA